MSHLETATLTTDNGAINIPMSGVGGETDPRKVLQLLLQRGWQPLPFPNAQAAIDAAKKASDAWQHLGPQTSVNPLEGLIQQLLQQAGPRGATFAGRALPQGQPQSLQDILGRFPQGETESGGVAMQSPELLRSLLMVGAFGPIRTPAQKQMAKAAWRANPEQVRQVLHDPRPLDFELNSHVPTGQYIHMPPEGIGFIKPKEPYGQVQLNPSILRGFAPEHSPPAAHMLPSITTHETQHHLTETLLSNLIQDPIHFSINTLPKMDQWSTRLLPLLEGWKLRPDAANYIQGHRLAGNPLRAFDEATAIAAEALADKKIPGDTKDILVKMMQEWWPNYKVEK